MKRTFFVSILLIFVIFIFGCENTFKSDSELDEQNFLTVEDDLGNKVTLNKKPERIVVTSAAFLEPLHAIGANIVGRPDSKNKTPDWAKDIPSVGQVYQIDIERVMSCKPDLVILNKGMNEKIPSILNENKISVLVIEMKTYQEVKHTLEIFSKISGEPEKGEELNRAMDDDIRQILSKLPDEKKRVIILHSTAQGLTVQLNGSIAGNIVDMLNWENVASDMTPLEKRPDSASYSFETLVEKNPEIIFITSMGNLDEIKSNMQGIMLSNEVWQTLTAVKNNEVYYLPQDLFLLSPGLDYPKAVKTMVQLVYPHIF